MITVVNDGWLWYLVKGWNELKDVYVKKRVSK